MSVTHLSSREVNQDIGRAKRAAEQGPVFITNRDRPTHVIMSYKDYQSLIGNDEPLSQACSMPGLADIEFEPAPLYLGLKPADLG